MFHPTKGAIGLPVLTRIQGIAVLGYAIRIAAHKLLAFSDGDASCFVPCTGVEVGNVDAAIVATRIS